MRKKKNRNKILKAGKQITWQDQKNRILNWQQRMLMTIPIYIMFMCAQSLSHVRLFATQATVAHQAPLSMRFSRQECWSGLPFPSPGELLDPGIEPVTLRFPALAGGFLTTSTSWEALQFTSQNLSKSWGIDGSRSLRKWRRRLKYGWVLKGHFKKQLDPCFLPSPRHFSVR